MASSPTYELLQEIGRSEFATVHRARDFMLKRYVAVKELHERFRQDPARMEQFWEEAQFLANLEHPNIVQVFGVDKDQGWLILELMRGSLNDKLTEGPLPPDLVRSVLRQALEALQFLHKRNRLHGSVKPSNLLINDEGWIKLSDSAGVSMGGEMRRPTGTPKYLAPELLNPQFGAVGPGVDLYALGFTALELLKGRQFDGLFKGVGADAADAGLGWLRWHSSLTESLPPVREVVPGVPPDLAAVIDRLIVKRVGDRYATAADAVRDLEERPIQLVDLPDTDLAPSEPAEKKPVAETRVTPVGPPPDQPPTDVTQRPMDNSRSLEMPHPSPYGGPSPKPWTWAWMKKKLEEPKVLYPVLAAIVIPTLVLLLMPDRPAKPSGGEQTAEDGKTQDHGKETTVKPEKGGDTTASTKAGPSKTAGGGSAPVRDDTSEKLQEKFAQLQKQFDQLTRELKKSEGASKNQANLIKKLEERVKEASGSDEALKKELAVSQEKYIKILAELAAKKKDRDTAESALNGKPGKLSETSSPPGGQAGKDQPGDRSYKNKLGMEFVLISAGEFQMGDEKGEPDEKPVHPVRIARPFYFGKTEVTQDQYKKVMGGGNPSFFSADGGGSDRLASAETGALPVEQVKFEDAAKFCEKLAESEGLDPGAYRLPTEAEWEYAARAGGQDKPVEPGDANFGEAVWFYSNSDGRPHPVGQKAANAWGLLDMQGNIAEWCSDWHEPEYYLRSAHEDPSGPADRPATAKKVLRGGSWVGSARSCRVADRDAAAPDSKLNCYGLRVVLDPVKIKKRPPTEK